MKTATKERPILFSAPMVRAILDGRKTQTRRVIKPQPPSPCVAVHIHNLPTFCIWPSDEPDEEGDHPTCGIKCPYGRPGDRLWVRETCKADQLESGMRIVRYMANEDYWPVADGQEAFDNWFHLSGYGGGDFRQIPSIHMPRWASRITLEITDVRVEQLQDISEADAQAEGAEKLGEFGSFRCDFIRVWESINGPGSWAANPWVWVVEFKQVVP